MAPSDLPEGWAKKTIAEVCERPQYGHTASANTNPVGPKFLRITDIQQGIVDWNTVPYCRCAELAKYRLASGDILFARTGATTGKSYSVVNPPDAVFASYLIRLRPRSSILPGYLSWYFRSPYYWDSLVSGIEDGNRPSMNATKLARVEIAFPADLGEQRRIVLRIEELTSRLRQAAGLHREAERNTATLFHVGLESAFSEREITDWPTYEAKRLFVPVNGQVDPRGHPYVDMPHVGPDSIETGTCRLLHDTIQTPRALGLKSGKYPFGPEHVLYSKIRPALRKVALPDFAGVCSADMYPLLPNTELILREFLALSLLSPAFSQYAVDNSDRNAMPKINRKTLFAFEMPVPDKKIQQEVVDELLGLQSKAQKLAEVQQALTADIDSFMPALLAKAFRGEL